MKNQIYELFNCTHFFTIQPQDLLLLKGVCVEKSDLRECPNVHILSMHSI